MQSLLPVLLGTWFICSTNFPMWTKGHKTHPAFTYGLMVQKNGTELLSDNVTYLKHGKSKSIKGYDYPSKTDSSIFTWRGKGLLRVLKSKWKVALIDPAHSWVVIYFSKTAFTPEGVDIISRTPSLSKETLEQIKLKMQQDPVLKSHILSLKNL